MRVIKIGFPGNKSNRVKEIAELTKNGNYKRVVEVFGGSCVISNNLLKEKIVEEAIANDYDHHFDKFEEYIEFKKDLVGKLLNLGFEKAKDKKLSKEKQEILQALLKDQESNLLKYLSKNFVFSCKIAAGTMKMQDFTYFMNEIEVDNDIEYIKNLRNVGLDSLDYIDFMEKYIKNDDKNTIVIVDPPYLNSAQKQYGDEFFGLEKTIKLLNVLKEKRNDFIFFNQKKEDSTELLKLYGFDFMYSTKQVSMSGATKREDFMAYVKFDEVTDITGQD